MKISVLFFIGTLIMTMASPVAMRENINNMIIDVGENDTLVSGDELDILLRQTITATKETAGGIVRSRLGFMRVSRSGSGFTIPGVPGIEFTSKLSGSVTFNGYLARSVDTAIDALARQVSSNFFSFYNREKRSLQTRAGTNFFSFFQAAATYGYTDDEETRRIIGSSDFKGFSTRTRDVLRNSESQRLIATYDTTYTGVSTGRRDVVQAFAYILINQLTLDSGELLNVVKGSPELVVADDDGEVIDRIEPGAIEVKAENINDSVIDVTIS